MNRRLITAGLGLGILILAALGFTAMRGLAAPRHAPPELRAFMPPPQWNLPAEGWSVCRVGSEEPIEGVGTRQVFDLCHAQGWTLKTYCLDPGMPIPAIGTVCSQVVGGTYWCGDGVQQLGLIDVLQAPETATVPTETTAATATSTSPYPPPSTATFTATVTSTSPYPPPPTATFTVTTMPTRQASFTPTITSTPYNRPAPGGPGNLEPLLRGFGSVAALGLAGGAAAAGLRRGSIQRWWRRIRGRG